MARSKLGYVGVGALLGCICTLILLRAAVIFPREPLSSRHKTLVSMLGPVRLTEGRLNGQAGYAPYPTSVDRRSSAWKRFREQALQRADLSVPDSMRDFVFVDLVNRGVDAAIAEIEGSLEPEAGEATLMSDLSALYDERARAKNRSADYVSALDLAEQAVTLSPDLPEARFNKALALEHFFLYEEARAAWEQYLETDPQSQWSEEVRNHITRISLAISRQHRIDPSQLLSQAIATGDEGAISRLSRANPQEARDVLETNLIPRWAEAIARGEKEKSARRLSEARCIAETLADRGGDRAFQRVVLEMQEATKAPRSPRTAAFVQGLRQYRIGLDKWAEEGWSSAVTPKLMSARRILGSIQSTAVMMPQFQQAPSQFNQGDAAGARKTLEGLRKDLHTAEYPSLEARSLSLLGFIDQQTNALTSALAEHRNALSIFESLRERGNSAAEQNEIASILDSLGRYEEGWQHRYSALTWASQAPRGQPQLYTMFDTFREATFASLDQHRPRAALAFQSRSLSLAKNLQGHAQIIRAFLRRARIEAALGRRAPAKQDFDEAIKNLQLVHTVGTREALAPLIDTARREIDESEDRTAAIAQELHMSSRLSVRADFDFQNGDTTSAKSDLGNALDSFERQRQKVGSGNDRVSFLDQAQPLYERMTALQLHLAKPEEALETMERFRSRALLEQLKNSFGSSRTNVSRETLTPIRWREMCRRIPAHTDIIFFASVEGRLISWLLRPSGILVSAQEPSWNSVSLWAKGLHSGPGSRPDNFGKGLEVLYRELVWPWRNDLPAGDRIIFVPTKSLYSVPFAALRNPINGRFLVQDHVIGIAPSISEFLAAIEQDQKFLNQPLSTVLLVGSPTTDTRARESEIFPGNLPGADREIKLLSTIYEGVEAWVLTQKTATPARVLALLGNSDVAHFAVHALETPRDPGNSRLVLSSEEGKSGDLFGRDILSLHLDRTRLVMLASCSTQVGPISPSEGSLSLAYYFLAAGVPAVVGSLWHVDDASTARFSVRFHQELRRGADALSALRTAQLEELEAQQRNSDWTWASFQVFGGVAARAPNPAQVR
jgi:tetratricopeptide (TPR) repeat protein